jgi:hypothetical protein
MIPELQRIGDYVGSFFRALTFWRRNPPVTTPAGLAHFVDTRSKFVAQTTLYGYLKTRAGTRYVSLFEDDTFVASINISKWEIYFACLSDLTVHAVARAGAGSEASRDEMAALARWCFEQAAPDTKPEEMRPDSTALARSAFDERLAGVVWQAAEAGDTAFDRSPQALVEWAPVAPELKEYDAEIVANSLRFKWQNIRAELAKSLDGPAVMAAWRAGDGGPVTAH